MNNLWTGISCLCVSITALAFYWIGFTIGKEKRKEE